MIDDIVHILQQTRDLTWQRWLISRSRLPLFSSPNATIAINMFPAYGSWGGSSVFVYQLISVLRHCGLRPVFDLRGDVDLIFLIDPREDLQNKAFGLQEIKEYRQRNPEVRVIHRINECDQRKGTAFIDDALMQASDLVDHTIFISEWLREYFIGKWFDASRSHNVIYNGSDSAIFHPVGGSILGEDGTMRIVTHHWSDNPMKGFPLYKQLDDLIADGVLENVELWIIGRWPEEISWRAARTFPPTSGKQLAELLRQCHAYITASLWEPCGMHHVEGAQCGLPLLYHEDGGGIVEAGRKYGIGFREETLVNAIEEMRTRYAVMRRQVFESMPDGTRMVGDYVRIIQALLARVI